MEQIYENAPIDGAHQGEVIEVSQADMLAAINKSEIDTQIATAKQYPRNLARVLNNIETLATMDEDTAASCFYILRRQGKVIEGPSVRMAEIIASSWGNLRLQARIVGNDGKVITAQGVCHDLESNYATSVEVKRRITNKYGKTFSDDMQVVTGNAACAIAKFAGIILTLTSRSFIIFAIGLEELFAITGTSYLSAIEFNHSLFSLDNELEFLKEINRDLSDKIAELTRFIIG